MPIVKKNKKNVSNINLLRTLLPINNDTITYDSYNDKKTHQDIIYSRVALFISPLEVKNRFENNKNKYLISQRLY